MADAVQTGSLQRDNRARILGSGFQIKVAYADGAAADTDITITGIKPGDSIISALHLNSNATAGKMLLHDLTTECRIKAADTIQFTDTSTAGANEQVLIFYISW